MLSKLNKYDLSVIKTPFTITLVGIPLVGKSTFINNLYGADFEVVSSDAIMLEMHGSDENYEDAYQSINPDDLDAEIVKRIVGLSGSGKNVVFDITNTVKRRRLRNISQFPKKKYTHIAIVFQTPSDIELRKRNQHRIEKYNKSISEKLLLDFALNYQPISEDENFDIIINL